MALVQLLAGLALLLVGGRLLVDAAVAIAWRLGVPPLLIGLTVVAWGTSAPELALNLTASVLGTPDLTLGNVVGANLCNLGLALGIAALVRPLVVHATVVQREIPMLLLLMALFAAATLGGDHVGLPLRRLKGGMMLVLFASYSIYVVRAGLRQRQEDQELTEEVAQSERPLGSAPLRLALVALLGGLALLTVGGNMAARAAVDIAHALGVSDRVVGVTIVSIGTTLPEMATGLIAVLRGHVDLTVGNAVGSCLFNLGCIYGLCSLIAPAPAPPGALPSIAAMCVLGAALVPMSRASNRALARLEGTLLLIIYGLWMAVELMGAQARTPLR
ncbi:MAG: calcium/sodium antiporter [Myxococcales bacterium]|nr:calcium/sodium antiporter [Myxococcota bacterium]MDW8282287.1 calcium/sodium antiporter [Myxococcales bacterium]